MAYSRHCLYSRRQKTTGLTSKVENYYWKECGQPKVWCKTYNEAAFSVLLYERQHCVALQAQRGEHSTKTALKPSQSALTSPPTRVIRNRHRLRSFSSGRVLNSALFCWKTPRKRIWCTDVGDVLGYWCASLAPQLDQGLVWKVLGWTDSEEKNTPGHATDCTFYTHTALMKRLAGKKNFLKVSRMVLSKGAANSDLLPTVLYPSLLGVCNPKVTV